LSSAIDPWPRYKLVGKGHIAEAQEVQPAPSQLRRRILRVAAPFLGGLGSLASVQTSERIAALTFDDGPDPDVTPAVLDVLREYEARATFFLLVDRAEAAPDLTRRIIDEGHEVALHGLDHSRLTELGAREARRRTALGRTRLEQLCGRPITLFRPAFGAQGLIEYLSARQLGMRVILWNASALDWLEQTPDDVADTLHRATRPGSIVLMHDGYESVAGDVAPTFDKAKALALSLDRLRADGHTMTTVSDLLARGPAMRVLWFGS
jgi:peptidoglycan/xylan/chitin deacetylase (PgdA/CDA1 family)